MRKNMVTPILYKIKKYFWKRMSKLSIENYICRKTIISTIDVNKNVTQLKEPSNIVPFRRGRVRRQSTRNHMYNFSARIND